MKHILATVTLLTASLSSFASQTSTEQYYESIKSNPHLLETFLAEMPKGADLHSHESGATFIENMLRYASSDNLCINRTTFEATADPQCDPKNWLNTAVKDKTFYDALMDAWSMHHFQSTKESGHDHFFAAFSKFGLITKLHHGDILAEVTQRAAKENELYVELMVTTDGSDSVDLGKKIGWDPDLVSLRNKLLAADFNKILVDSRNNLNVDETKMRDVLACGTEQAKPGCQIKVKYQYQVKREQAPELVFAQLLAGFEIARNDTRVVGLNMVQPEDGLISMRDYKLQMQMVGFLHQLYPEVSVSLHAGELNNLIVPADGLKFHIRDAVEVANANRIGHGVDIAQEDNASLTMQDMAAKHVLVEINLSSNADILGIAGKDHPLPLYMQYGVPVALSTDDEGVTRNNLTNQYKRAVTAYQFSYPTVKKMVRNSIAYAFVAGRSLWQENDYQHITTECMNNVPGAVEPSISCQMFLASSEKATLQWTLENKFTQFESKF